MKLRNTIVTLLLFTCTIFTVSCESASHENIDKWATTAKGPGKLMDALKSSDNNAELRAHAAQILIRIERFPDVKEILEGLEDSTRHKIMAVLATRLWDSARINNPTRGGTPTQSAAKDALFYLLELADSETQTKMSEYIVEWFVGGQYERRAKEGRVTGAMAIRKVGGQAGKRLLNNAKAIVNTPPNDSGKRPRVGDELLRALAITGDKDTLLYLMDLTSHPRGDDTLPQRVVAAIYFAFLEPTGFEAVDGKYLAPIADRLAKIHYMEGQSATMRNDALALLVAVGAPECIPYFTKMIGRTREHNRYRWRGAQKGIQCAGLQGLEAITDALTPEINYERGLLDKYLWDEIYKLGDDSEIAKAAERLLMSENWVVRVTGIEVLAKVGGLSNTESIKALSGDKHRLKNWWGPQKDVPKATRKPEPTIGELASNVAKKLASSAKGK